MERRQQPRVRVSVEATLRLEGQPERYGMAVDINPQGASVTLWGGEPPSEESDVQVRFRVWAEHQVLCRLVSARVMRVCGDTVALRFLEPDLVTEAVVSDILYYLELGRSQTSPGPIRPVIGA